MYLNQSKCISTIFLGGRGKFVLCMVFHVVLKLVKENSWCGITVRPDISFDGRCTKSCRTEEIGFIY